MALSKAAKAQELELTKKLLALPAEQIRAIALLQRDAYAKKLESFPSWTEGKYYQDQLVEIDSQMRWGDELKASTLEAERQQRRRFYARAYRKAVDAASRLDAAKADSPPAVLVAQDVLAQIALFVEPATQKAGEMVDTAVDAVFEAGHDIKNAAGKALEAGENTLYLLAGGLVIAGIAYAVSAGRRGRRG